MAKKKRVNVEDFTDSIKEIGGLVKNNYLNSIDFATSMWEMNLKTFNAQVDHVFELEKEYINTVTGYYDSVPQEVVPFWNGNSKTIKREADKMVDLQKDYVHSMREFTDKFTKEVLALTQKNADRVLTLFDDYLNAFKI